MGVRIRQRGKKGQVSVRVYHNSIKLERKVQGITLIGFSWSQKKQRVLTKGSVASELNHKLQALKSNIEKSIVEASISQTLLDNRWLQRKINDVFAPIEKVSDSSVVQYTERLIESNEVATRTTQGYKTWLNNFKRFEEEIQHTFLFKDLDASNLRAYKYWLKNKENNFANSYINKQISTIKAICRKARAEGIMVNPFFDSISLVKAEKREENVVTLSWDEINRVEVLENLPEHLERARCWFYLGICIGQRGGDLLSITKKNIYVEEGETFLTLKQKKTGTTITAHIWYDKALCAIAKLDDLTEKRKPLPLQRLNDYIKELCKLAKIDNIQAGYIKENGRKVLREVPKYHLCASHLFRRTFSTISYKNKVHPLLIMNTTGHKNLKTFMGYINEEDQSKSIAIELGNEMRKIKNNN